MIADNLREIRRQIKGAAQRAGRSAEDITLVAVSKHQDIGLIKEAIACGQTCFGENYLQEAEAKVSLCPATVQWHFIGHLQSNKAKLAAALFHTVETVDRLKIAKALDREAANLGRSLDVLVQVNVGREQQKSGISPEELPDLLFNLRAYRHLVVRGLMTMPPYFDDPELSRPFFRMLRTLAEQCGRQGLFHDNSSIALSMGMSGDFTTAIEEGATIVRVGTSIFGARPSTVD